MTTLFSAGLAAENDVLAKRPYLNTRGDAVIAVNTGQLDGDGQPVYKEKVITANSTTLRKDEWIDLEDQLLEAFRERLVIVADMQSAGLTYPVGGLGTIVSEWETSSEMTDAQINMDGESTGDKDSQEFGLDGVPIPLTFKDHRISERMLLASRSRGAALDVTQGVEAARSVARTLESLVFNGSTMGAVRSAANSYTLPGLLTKVGRPLQLISDWASGAVSAETVLAEVLLLIQECETLNRTYGPYTLYIPGAYAAKMRQDFKANSDKTLMTRLLEINEIAAIRISDTLPSGNVLLVQMTRSTFDLAVASDVTTVQWQSGSGFSNFFKTYAAMAPRIKTDFDGRFGYIHGATST